MKKILVLSVIALMIVMTSYVSAESIDNIRVLKISPQDGKAVVKTADRELKMIKVGDVLGTDSEFKVMEIADGRILFEKGTDKGTETLIVRLENGKQKVERIRKVMDKQQLISKPLIETVSQGNGSKSITGNSYSMGKDGSEFKVKNTKNSSKFKVHSSE